MSEPGTETRESLFLPIVLPIGLLAIIAVVLFGFSRILLHVTKHAATAVALATAVTIFGVASFVATRKRLSGSALLPMVGTIAGIVLFLGGGALLAAQKQAEHPGLAALAVSLVAPQGASANGFATKTLAFQAERPTNLLFQNQETGVQHNVVIYKGSSATGSPVFTGDLVTGPGQALYKVPPLPAGNYYFHCEVHPTTMFGTINVAAGAPGTLSITAANVAFNTDKLSVTTPNVALKLLFQNKDAGIPHDFALYKDKGYTQALFTGDQITGPATTTYSLPALAPGTYYFHCTVHPTTMTGTLVVSGGSSPPTSGSASPSG